MLMYIFGFVTFFIYYVLDILSKGGIKQSRGSGNLCPKTTKEGPSNC